MLPAISALKGERASLLLFCTFQVGLKTKKRQESYSFRYYFYNFKRFYFKSTHQYSSMYGISLEES